MPAAISVRQLAVVFPGRFRRPAVHALHPFDLDVEPGTILGVLGPNGSGKTTLLRVLAGLQRPTTGTAHLLSLPPDHPTLRRRVAFQPAGALPLGVLSAPEFLQYIGCVLRLPDRESDARAALWLDRLDLRHAKNRAVKTFSTGMQQRLALAAALLGEPEVLLLDEPTSGLDPLGSAAVMQILQERAAAGTTVLLASHHLQEVEQICNQVIVLQDGELRARGTLDELLGGDELALIVRGIPASGTAAVSDAIRQQGGELVRTERSRAHLFALFRRLQQQREDRQGPR